MSFSSSMNRSPYPGIPPSQRDYICGHLGRKWCSYCQSCLRCPPKEHCVKKHEEARNRRPGRRSRSKAAIANSRGNVITPNKDRASKQMAVQKLECIIDDDDSRESSHSDSSDVSSSDDDNVEPIQSCKEVTVKVLNITMSAPTEDLPLKLQREAVESDIKRKLEKIASLEVELAKIKKEIASASDGEFACSAELLCSIIQNSVNNFNSKEKLQLLYSVLGIDDESAIRAVAEINRHGYSAHEMKPHSRQLRRASLVYSAISNAIDNVICSKCKVSDAFVVAHRLAGNTEKVRQLKKLEETTLDLSILGDASASKVADALLARNYEQKTLKRLVKERCVHLVNTRNDLPPIRTNRKKFGKQRTLTARQICDMIMNGETLTKAKRYPFRVPIVKLISAMEFLSTKLPFRPGITRSITVGEYTFDFLPVYQRGGKNAKKLFKEYAKSQMEHGETFLGRHSFNELVKFLSKKGETKTGLSTYYVKLAHAFDNLGKMLEKIDSIAQAHSMELSEADKATKMTKESGELKDFLTYGYAKSHLQIESKIPSHCCRHALNERDTCKDLPNNRHTHNEGDEDCKQCARVFTYFDEFAQLVTQVRDKLPEDATGERQELTGMLETVPLLKDHMIKYMGHQVRAFVQHHEIKQRYKNLQEDVEIILTLDHKQKTLSMKHREGQVEYFGKAGMSLLGAMKARRVRRLDKKRTNTMKTGIEKIHFDVVFDRYKSQDSPQVLGALQCLIDFIHQEFPEVKKVTLLSDNASCFASHDCIPFIYDFNQRLKDAGKNIRVDCWIFTEACTGKDDLDAHFSFINTLFGSYILDEDHKIMTEDDMFEALQYEGGLAGSYAIKLDSASLALGKKHVYDSDKEKKAFKATKTGVRATHEIEWPEPGNEGTDNVPACIRTISRITEWENITPRKINNYPTRVLDVKIAKSWKGDWEDRTIWNKTPRFRFDDADAEEDEPALPTNQPQPKANSKEAKIKQALSVSGIGFGVDERAAEVTLSDCCGFFKTGWARYPKQTEGKPMKKEVQLELMRLWRKGQKDKSGKVTAEQAFCFLTDPVDGLIRKDWPERFNVSIIKIKSFFQKNESEMKRIEKTLLEGGDATAAEDLKERLESLVGERVALYKRVDDVDVVKLGVVMELEKLRKEGRGRGSRTVGAFYTVEYDDGSIDKSVIDSEIDAAMKLFEEVGDENLVREAEEEALQDLLQDFVRQKSTDGFELPLQDLAHRSIESDNESP